MERVGKAERITKETAVKALFVVGAGEIEISTGLPFFDHMLHQLYFHGGFSGYLKASGDLEVDAHHTVEDVGITLGQAISDAVKDRSGIERFGWAAVPLDEALVETALDLCGRPYLNCALGLEDFAQTLGSPGFSPQLAEEFLFGMCRSAGLTLHLLKLSGRNPHHILEAAFKALGKALEQALRIRGTGVPSTKGTL